MNTRCSWIVIAIMALFSTAPVLAESFKVGDHVTYPGIGFSGTIIQVGGASGTVMVLRDGSPNDGTRGVWYDPARLKHSPAPAEANGQQGGQPDQPAWQQPAAQPAWQQPAAQPAWQQPAAQTPARGGDGNFKVGDNVILLGRYEGTVIAVGGPSGQVQVKLTTSPVNAPPSSHSWYEPRNLRHGGGGDRGGHGWDPGASAGVAPATPTGVAIRDAVQVPNNAPANVETFKKIIMSHTSPAMNQTVYFDFQQFQPTGNGQFNNAYAGNLAQETILGGPGDVYKGQTYHVKFVKRFRDDNPNAADQVATFEGDYTFFKDKNGEWNGKTENVQMSPLTREDRR